MLRIGILRGGGGSSHDQSISSGAYPLFLISEKFKDKYKVYDIFVDKQGVWHFRGVPVDPLELNGKIDIILNAIGDEYLNLMHKIDAFSGIGIPHTGSGKLSRMISENVELTKDRFKTLGIKHIDGFRINYEGEYGQEHAKNIAKRIWEKVPPPWIVKPVRRSSGVGIHVCKTFGDLADAIEENFANQNDILIEEMINGKNVITTIVDGYRGESPYVFPFFENAEGQHKIAKLDDDTKSEINRMAKEIYKEFGVDHLATLHFVVHPKKGIYAEFVDTHPSFAQDSHIMNAVSEVGGTHEGFIEHLIEMVRK